MKFHPNSILPPSPSPPAPAAAAEFIAGNSDLLEEILLRLPPKSLVKFKSVSKLWLSTISSPVFGRRHARLHSRRRPSGLLLRTHPNSIHSQYQFLPLRRDPPSDGLNFVPHPAAAKVLQSCNGLLLCCTAVREIGHSRSFLVFNPTTNLHTLIPQLSAASPGITVFGASLAFDPSISPHYKVVCVRSTGSSDYHYQIEIYSSEHRAWRLSGSPFAAPFDMVFDNGVFWNGAVHWISPSRSSLYFDVENEHLRAMLNVPVSRNSGARRFRYFGESNGYLQFFEIYGSQTTRFKVFEMERDYSQWFTKYEVDLDPIVKAFPEIVRDYIDPGDVKHYYAFVTLLLLRGRDDNASSSMLIHVPGKIVAYDLAEKSFKKLYEIPTDGRKGHGFLQYGWLDAYEFIESLAPV